MYKKTRQPAMFCWELRNSSIFTFVFHFIRVRSLLLVLHMTQTSFLFFGFLTLGLVPHYIFKLVLTNLFRLFHFLMIWQFIFMCIRVWFFFQTLIEIKLLAFQNWVFFHCWNSRSYCSSFSWGQTLGNFRSSHFWFQFCGDGRNLGKTFGVTNIS